MQFDWSQEVVMLSGVKTILRVAHFRMAHSRKQFVRAYLREAQEILLDASNNALAFYQGVSKQVLVDNSKTMMVSIGQDKGRDFHQRFVALMNHYLVPTCSLYTCVRLVERPSGKSGQVGSRPTRPRLQYDDLALIECICVTIVITTVSPQC
jgi:hypothetical protein